MSALFVGAPVAADKLYEQGIERSLDEMRDIAAVNNVLVFSNQYQARQYVPGFAPRTNDAGRAITDVHVRTDESRYANTTMRQVKDSSALYADRDIIDDLADATAARGMTLYARILEPYVITGAIPGMEKCAEVNALGEKSGHVCYNHPDYIAWWEAVVADLVHSHPRLQGFKFGQERGGPLLASLRGGPGTCFCEHCLPLARARGVDTKESREGLIALSEFAGVCREGGRHRDGNFVTFLRILFEHPAVLAHERFWMDSREAQRRRMYTRIKAIRECMQVGWHICHGMTWDIVTRAVWDYGTLGGHSDWLSIAVYFDSFGRRSMNHYDENYRGLLFGDASEEISYPMYLSLIGLDPGEEPALAQHREHDRPMSAGYTYREVRRAVRAVNGAARIYARIGFDMPDYDAGVTPEQVREAVFRALDAGADGLFCGREWDELTAENRRAFGDAVRDYRREPQRHERQPGNSRARRESRLRGELSCCPVVEATRAYPAGPVVPRATIEPRTRTTG